MRGWRPAGLVALLALLCAWPTLAQPRFPALSGRVVDAANILPAETEARLTQRLATLETSTGRQLVVATVPDLQGYEVEEYGYQLGRAWGIGARGRNDGALLIVAPAERKVRIEVGYGLEGVLTDAWTGQLLRNQVLPRFRGGDYPGGVTAGVDALIAQLSADPEVARRNLAQATEARRSGGGSPFGSVIITVLIVWLVFSIISGLFRKGGRRGRRGSGLGPAIVWGSGLGSGSRGGGWGGGGGFSGGGGSFGGGGSSGGW